MEIKEVGVVGAGTMGCQIVGLFLKHGFNVTLFSKSDMSIKNCLTRLKKKNSVENLKVTTRLEDLKGKDLLIESVKEDLQIKREIFKQLDNIAGENTIIASNTSSITLQAITKNCKNKKNMIGLHFFNPAHHMKLVEIPKPDFTSQETLNKILELAKKLEKEPIVVKDIPGFLLNRILFVMLNEAANTLYAGIATRDEIDNAAILGANYPLGPLKIIDIVGIDVTVDILKNLQKELNDNKFAPSPILLQMLKENKLGRKTKKGFYNY